ncbi:hypothetical protein Zmor_023262 [Zophobas morio]|uniref:Uncharacterized protein n=1 Tax=Zophobas morio TaxID=2755281 RepID=A0AA38M6V1_9CUCU|nr:hypothetical protein Zmor_023262 [Zophobas morio]
MWRTFKSTGSESSYKAHREFSNHLSCIIREARFVYEKRIPGNKNPRSIFKHIRIKLSGPVRSLQLKDDSGVAVHEGDSVANIFADTFVRGVIVEPPLKDLSLSSKYNPDCIEHPSFPSEIVLGKLKKIKTYKSAGPDLISANRGFTLNFDGKIFQVGRPSPLNVVWIWMFTFAAASPRFFQIF